MAQQKPEYLTSHFQFDFIDKEARVFGFAEAALKLWTLPSAVINYIDKAADKLIAFLTAIFLIAVLVLIVPAAFVVLLLLSLLLGYCMLFFNYHRSKNFSTFDQLERKDLIELHVKIKHTIKRMQSLKSSKFLFATPILGAFMKAYYNQLYVLEEVLKVRAYPNYNQLPKNPVVHDYNPEDPWQKDMSDMKKYQDLPIN